MDRLAAVLVTILFLRIYKATNSALPAQLDRGHRCLSRKLYDLYEPRAIIVVFYYQSLYSKSRAGLELSRRKLLPAVQYVF